MNGTQTFNVNAAECLRDVTWFGSTQVHNICTGAVTSVPWGMSEWATTALLGLLAAVMLMVFGLLLYIAGH